LGARDCDIDPIALRNEHQCHAKAVGVACKSIRPKKWPQN
jgi:hypothetical protein